MQSTYNIWLVLLSVAVAVFVSFVSLRLAARVAEARGEAGRSWLLVSAFAMGAGIWSMHFIGMLAFSVPVELRYRIVPTVLSLVIAICTSGFSIYIASRRLLGGLRLGVCSVLMGLGIAGMHYCGMSAIPLMPEIEYDPALVILSICIAVGASFVALWLIFNLRCGRRRFDNFANLGAAALMGLAIAGMHYIAMAAAHFPVGAVCRGGVSLDNQWLAAIVAMGAVALLAITLIIAMYDAKVALRSRLYAQRLERVNARLAHQATHDALTGLPNRATFLRKLEHAIEQSKHSRKLLAVMLVDLDRFKIINDSLGHGFGDAVVREVARILADAAGAGGCASRLGGDEFLVLIEVAETREIARTAASIVERVSKTYQLGNLEVFLSASVGITTFPFDNAPAEVLVSHADEAMYESKHQGGGGYRFFLPGTTIFTMDRLQLENDLRRAVRRKQLELHYQPVVEVASGMIVGVEALARWRHPERGWVSPAEFIPIAESSDIIVQLGEWVLQEACRQAREWVAQGFDDLSVAVNVSARQFRQAGLLRSIVEAVEKNHLAPRNLVIELTESVVMSDADRSIGVLQELSRCGFQIAVDDFGTGYSSMNYLKQLPVTKLKIDKSFVQDLGKSAKSDAIVRAVTALAHGLGIAVVAEGVETAAQLTGLLAYGCDQYQGYLCSRPRDPAALSELLRQKPFAIKKSDITHWLLNSA